MNSVLEISALKIHVGAWSLTIEKVSLFSPLLYGSCIILSVSLK